MVVGWPSVGRGLAGEREAKGVLVRLGGGCETGVGVLRVALRHGAEGCWGPGVSGRKQRGQA